MIADGDFKCTQDFLAHFADGDSKNGHRFRCIEIENRQEILMLETRVGMEAAPKQERVFEADGGGLAKGSAYVKLIIPF